jgi:hypothetical protein
LPPSIYLKYLLPAFEHFLSKKNYNKKSYNFTAK